MEQEERFTLVSDSGERMEAVSRDEDGQTVVTLSSGRPLEVISDGLYMNPSTSSLLRRE